MVTVVVDVSAGPHDSWMVQITSPHTDVRLRHYMSRLSGPNGGYPVVSAEALPADLPDAVRNLATTANCSLLDNMHADIASRQPGDDDIVTFGSYLHTALFGPYWKVILDEVAGQHLEIMLRLQVSDWELARLPWEMMHGPDLLSGKYVPVTWHVPVARLVPGATLPPERKVCISPRVLFVVGTDLHDTSIRPGAEFFTVWERLQQEGILFDFRILQRATSQQIEDEIEAFQPSIVHFICHGVESGRESHLELVSSDTTDRSVIDRRDASRLLDLLRTKAGDYPQIVVLNACYSGIQPNPDSARVHAPLAAALVAGGVPIVLGMGGEISDQACRLFARSFYSALLKGQSVCVATGEGRRAGMKHGLGHAGSGDWALPMLFIADQLLPEVEIDASEVRRVAQRAALAQRVRGEPNPAAFCDRIDVMEAARALMDPKRSLRVMVIEETDYERNPLISGKSGKFGKTRVLREIAARAFMEGNLPCILVFAEGDELPTSSLRLAYHLAQAIDNSAAVIGAPDFSTELFKLFRAASDPTMDTASLHDSVRREYERWRHSGRPALPSRVIASALRLDLQALADLGKGRLDSPDLQVIVLVDDAHKFDAGARILTELITLDGFGDSAQPVPVIFAFSSQPGQIGFDSSIALLKKFVEDNSQGQHLRHFSLERFKSSEQNPFGTFESLRRDPLALVYKQFLLQLRPGIVLHRRASAQAANWFLDTVHRKILGVPSRLEVNTENRDVIEFIKSTLRQQQLVPGAVMVIDEIDDERALEEYRSGRP